MTGSFYSVECADCGNEQTVFGKVSTTVNCAVCGSTLARPTGGQTAFESEVVDTVEAR
ncbi:MAG: 30S ribosomal protein S27e [Haloplanus sp.]